MSLVKPRLCLSGLLRLLLVWVTAGNGESMQEEGVEWIWGHSKLPRSSMPSGGGQGGHHARNICPLPPHSRPEQNGEQLRRNMTAGLWIGFLSFRYVWEICVAQIDELREVCLLSEPGSGLGGAGFPPSQELKEQEEWLLVANTPGRSGALRSLLTPSTLDDATQTF